MDNLTDSLQYLAALIIFSASTFLLERSHRQQTASQKRKDQLLSLLKDQNIMTQKDIDLIHKSKDQSQKICILRQNLMNIKKEAYQFRQMVSIQNIQQFEKQFQELKQNKVYFFEKQSGGQLQLNKTTILKINDCTIDANSLQYSIQPIQILNKQKRPREAWINFRFLKNLNMMVLGSMGYSFSQQKVIIYPFLISKAYNIDDLKLRIQSFYDYKILQNKVFQVIILTMSLAGIFILLGHPNIKRKYQKILKFLKGDTWQTRGYVQIQKSNKLMCSNCKKRNVAIVYDCGHLCVCTECDMKKCMICHKKSKESTRIYL